MHSLANCFTSFTQSIVDYQRPEKFTFPFFYQPDPLCVLASKQLQQYLEQQTLWQYDFSSSGKMFGVLVVENADGELGYLSAFSGKLADSNFIPHFVPPVYDMLVKDSFFLTEQKIINNINDRVLELENLPQKSQYQTQLKQLTDQYELALAAHRELMAQGRKQRKVQRQAATELNQADLTTLTNQLSQQSIDHKNQLRDLNIYWQQRIDTVQQPLEQINQEISRLRQQRKQSSAILQQQLFQQYRFLNVSGQEKDLAELFNQQPNVIPPAGAGECAAPKLLQYAFTHQLKPIAMAEFWWGAVPKSEIRQQGNFYPACQGKCQPILSHMLLGLKMDDNPLLLNPGQDKDIDIIYQDDAILIINKPAGLLSVPGKNIKDSVLTRLRQQFPDAEGPLIVHRLDMATSGLMVIALTKRANKSLQKQFITRAIKKRYLALVDGEIGEEQGEISLPLRGDLHDRPRQIVCQQHGKPARTLWQVIERTQGKTLLSLTPETGRTHQLRVHCAHVQGLNSPIVGDDLYGKNATRLHLHAQWLQLTHPIKKQDMEFEVAIKFI